MARFYFQVQGGSNLGHEDGRELPDEDAALKEGLRFASHLMAVDASRPQVKNGWYLEIADQQRSVLFRIDVTITRASVAQNLV